MSRGWKRGFIAASVGMLGVAMPIASAGAAQDAAPPAAASDDVASNVAKAVVQLKLNPQQEAAFLAFEAMMVDKAQEPPADPDAFMAMSLPQRFDFVADHATASLTKIRAATQAVHHLYDLLTPDQRKQFDALNTPAQESAAPQSSALPASVLAGFHEPGRTEPAWLVVPPADEIARLYPRDARKKHVTGSTMLHCTVDVDGYLSDCSVTSETPKDAGFANAALQISSYMRMKPATFNGVPVEAVVNVPVNFSL